VGSPPDREIRATVIRSCGFLLKTNAREGLIIKVIDGSAVARILVRVLQRRECTMSYRFSPDASPEIAEIPAGDVPSVAPETPDCDLPTQRALRTAHQPFLDFVRYLPGDRDAISGRSVALARHRAETALLKTDRVLALLCRIEAIADHRADNDVAAVAKLPKLRDLAREAIETHTRAPFANPLFPLSSPFP
jgi:hypothetical protein